MTLGELKQVKKDLDNGIIISKATLARVLETAIQAEAFQQQFRTSLLKNTVQAMTNNSSNIYGNKVSPDANSIAQAKANQRQTTSWVDTIFGVIGCK